MIDTLRAETFAGINIHVFRVFQSFSRKFLPLEILNHQQFFKTQNARVFSKLIKSKKIIKMGQFSKVMIYFYLSSTTIPLGCFFLFWSCKHFSYFKFAKVFSAKDVQKIVKRESFCQIIRVFLTRDKFLPLKYLDSFELQK